jgi:hypothetical protein
MRLMLIFHPGIVRHGYAKYRRNEFALDCGVERTPVAQTTQTKIDTSVGIREPTWLAIADTLSIAFSGSAAELVSFDAYSNLDNWVESSDLHLPEVSSVGTIRLAQPPLRSDRIDLAIAPTFRYSPPQRRLQVEFGAVPSRYYQVSTCLIVGVDDDGLATLEVNELEVT